MSHKTLQLPGIGFLILTACYSTLAAFLYFGSQTPRLDEVFGLLSKREHSGFSGYSEADIRLFERTMRDFGGFSRALLGRGSARFLEPPHDGWLRLGQSHLAVRPDKNKPLQFQIEAEGKRDDFPLTLHLQGKGVSKTLQLAYGAPGLVEFTAADLSGPSILSVSVKGSKDLGKATPSWGVRVVPQTGSVN